MMLFCTDQFSLYASFLADEEKVTKPHLAFLPAIAQFSSIEQE